jgi:hypothetical protein
LAVPGPLQIPPLVVGGTSLFTMLGPGTANGHPLTLLAVTGPYSNTLEDLNIPSGSTLTITSKLGTLTSYTQQFEQQDRVSMVATPDSKNGHATPSFIPNAPFPDLNTVVDGVLDAGRVEIVDGLLSGTGTLTGSLNVFGPVSGYPDTIKLMPVDGGPIDPSWDNEKNTIRATSGGFLVAGKAGGSGGGGTPGELTVKGDVSLFGASFVAYAGGAVKQGSDYSWLSSDGKVNLGNSKLDLSLVGYTPQAGDSLTMITAANGISGTFSQGSSITVNGFKFNITYNANSVVLTSVPSLGATAPAAAPVAKDRDAVFVETLYHDVLKRPAHPGELSHWVHFLRSGGSPVGVAVALVTSPEYVHAHSSARSFVTGLYHDVLRRRPHPGGLATWVGLARAHPDDRVALAKAFLSAPGPRARLRELLHQGAVS